MATRAEHYARAEEYLAEMDKIDAAIRARRDGYVDPQTIMTINSTREYLMKRAEIHALMAGAAEETQ